MNVALNGEGVMSQIDGLALISGRQLADTHTVIDHAKPNGRSLQLHKTIVGGAAHAVFNGKIFVSPDKSRLEMTLEGQRQVMIARLDKRVFWMLMPEERMYVEMPIPERPEDALSGRDPTQKIERRLVGSETVSGHPTKKYKVTVTGKDETYVGYQWLAQDLGELPIRWEDEQGTARVELRNIKVGRQPAELFEVPAGFQKLAMPAGLPGMPKQ
ncbi:MAG: SufD family Fe-S cluster assembly protein [Candidatus Rokubacteria bacterium]|nr:SufD family Fe-S cluster assembly protein [Candidatus Rokubacteria bacterium]